LYRKTAKNKVKIFAFRVRYGRLLNFYLTFFHFTSTLVLRNPKIRSFLFSAFYLLHLLRLLNDSRFCYAWFFRMCNAELYFFFTFYLPQLLRSLNDTRICYAWFFRMCHAIYPSIQNIHSKNHTMCLKI